MIRGLRGFVETLRAAGVRVSPAEWIDSVVAAQRMGLGDRDRLRCALRATLVKHAEQRTAFDEAFARFFVAPRVRGRKPRRARPTGAGSISGRRGSEPEPRQSDGGRAPRQPRAVAGALKRRVDALRLGVVGREGRLRHVVRSDPRRDGPAQQAGTRHPGVARLRDLRRELEADEERALACAVQRLVSRIRLRQARRLRRTRRGHPDLRRLFRHSQRTGGVPFTVPRRRRRDAGPRVALLVDVSWSTARAAGLFLALAGEFVRLGRQARVILFVDRAVDATEQIERWLARADRPFPNLLTTLEGLSLSAPSDYGRVFHQLLGWPGRPRGRGAVLLVLGDGRCNRLATLPWAFEELTAACGAVIWLVPEPVALWGTGDSALGQYLPYVDTAVEADDLRGLARGVERLLRRL